MVNSLTSLDRLIAPRPTVPFNLTMSITLKEFVIKEVSSSDYYEKLFPEWSSKRPSHVKCIFHDDSSPSLNLNLRGGGAHCFGANCQTKAGNIVHFEALRISSGLPPSPEQETTAAEEIFGRHIRPVLAWEPTKIDRFLSIKQTSLKNNKDVYERVKKELLIDDDTIAKFRLGLIGTGKEFRISIPIFNVFGALVNIRHYLLPSFRTPENEGRKILSEKGYGSPASIFGRFPATPEEPLYFLQGERDTLLANDLGAQAICITGNESEKLSRHELNILKNFGKKITIIPDNDAPGLDALKKRIRELKEAGLSVTVARVPKEYKDFSQWIGEENPPDPFTELLPDDMLDEDPELFALETTSHEDMAVLELPIISFPGVDDPQSLPTISEPEATIPQIGRNPRLLNRVIEVSGVISAKLDRTYSIPVSFRIGDSIYKLPYSRELLSMIRASDKDITDFVAKSVRASKGKVTIEARETVTEVEIIPIINPGSTESIFVTQRCCLFGEHAEANMPYLMKIIPTTDMKTQETVGIIVSARPIANVVDSFQFGTETHKMLADKFQPKTKEPGAVQHKLQELAYEVSERKTNITSREDWHIVALLSWVSPLQFNFPEEGLQRGWINTLCLGDTETGKSKVVKSFKELFNCGEFISSENCSYVGLIGGAIKTASGTFMLRWGKVPLYNKQLIILEEMSGLSTTDISNMSEVRSSGIARLDKGGLSAQTSAKTRLICLSNVRGEGRSLSLSSSGVRELQELVGHGEDIARFDLIVTLTDNEVSNSEINRNKTDEETNTYTDDEMVAFRELAMFCWSLKPDQIEFTKEAYDAILNHTVELAKIYHPNVPIFKAGSGRFKLARIAVALAALQFSWDPEKEKLQVTKDHVDVTVAVLKSLFNKPSLGYLEYSKQLFHQERQINSEDIINEFEKNIAENSMLESVYRMLIVSDSFDSYDIATIGNVNTIQADMICARMFGYNFIRKNTTGSNKANRWQLSPLGNKWISEKLNELLE